MGIMAFFFLSEVQKELFLLKKEKKHFIFFVKENQK